MSKENLQNKTCKELRELAKDMNISGRWDMTKDQLIDAILGAEVLKKNDESESAKDECKIDNHDVVEVEDKVEKESANVDVDMAQKMPYIENIEIGTLVVNLPRIVSLRLRLSRVLSTLYLLMILYGYVPVSVGLVEFISF